MSAVRLERADGGRRDVVLDRPEKRNALDRVGLETFASVLGQLEDDDDARVVVVRSTSSAFCAGRDLVDPEIDALSPGPALRRWFNPLIMRLAELPVPTIAAVAGPALGAGFGIAFACDLVVVAESAMVGSPFVRLGGVLDCGGHHFLSERVGPVLARELIFTGRMLDGREAAAAGLACRCVPDAELAATVDELADAVGNGPTVAFRLSKRILNEGTGLHDVLEREADAVEAVKDTGDAAEGRRAFVERREPVFEGR